MLKWSFFWKLKKKKEEENKYCASNENKIILKIEVNVQTHQIGSLYNTCYKLNHVKNSCILYV